MLHKLSAGYQVFKKKNPVAGLQLQDFAE